MSALVILLLALTLLLAPVYAALPDSPATIASSEWTSFLCAGTFLAALMAVFAARREGSLFAAPLSMAEKAFLLLLGLAFLSIPTRLIVQHGTGYFGVMLRGWSVLAADFALFALARRVAVSRICLYALILAAAAGSAIVADLGVQEHVAHLRAGDPNARTFGTSTPDFLAGYFVLLLPVTLAGLLQMMSVRGLTPLLRGLASLVLGVILLFQLVTLLTTSSRFGLLSLVVALLVFALCLIYALRRGLILTRAARALLGVLAAGLLLGGAAFARPVLSRLHNLHDNSAAFRLWTWRGGLHMAAANPVLGTGVGAWTDLYPKYALTGFTRLAHNSYLQMADECGIPALLVLLAALGYLGVSLARGLSRDSEAVSNDFLPTDNRLLLCGLSGALAGGIVQNLIDSDWYVFFLGTTFWTLAGLASGIALPETETPARRIPTSVLLAAGSVAAALTLLTGTQGVGAGYALTAQSQLAADPGGAAQSLGLARAWDPLNGQYASDLGFQVNYAHLGDVLSAEDALQEAVTLEPNSVNYRRLGTVLQAAGKPSEATAAYQAGLRAEPNSLDLLLRLARLSHAPASLAYYRKISDLENSPVGTARALGESVEPTFAYGDAALGDLSAQASPGQAAGYYRRAALLLEAYAAEGGSLNGQREAISSGRADPKADTELRALYTHVMDTWIKIAPVSQRAALRVRQKESEAKFDAVISQSSKPGML